MEKFLTGQGTDREYSIRVQGIKLTVMLGRVPLGRKAPEAADPELVATRPHIHSWYELFYVKKGQLDCRMENSAFCLSEGEMLLVPPGYPHYTVAEAGTASRYALNFSIEAPAGGVLEEIQSLSVYRRIMPDGETGRAVELLTAAVEQGEDLLAGAYLWELALLLCRSAEPRPMENLLADDNISRIYKLEMLLNEYYASRLTAEAAAEALHLSTRQLGRLIRRQYGCTYLEKRTAMRMGAAEHLLLTTDETVTAIAARVGYDSIKCFYAAFRKGHGCLPGEWRSRHQKTAPGN